MRRDVPWFALLVAALSGCNPAADLDELFGGRWEVVDHQEAAECGEPAPAELAWSSLELEFVSLNGILGLTVARCEGGCDTPSAAVGLDVSQEDRLEGVDTEVGLFPSPDGDVCQASLIEVVATKQGERLLLDMRSFFGPLSPPADGDCELLVSEVQDDLCDTQLIFEAVR